MLNKIERPTLHPAQLSPLRRPENKAEIPAQAAAPTPQDAAQLSGKLTAEEQRAQVKETGSSTAMAAALALGGLAALTMVTPAQAAPTTALRTQPVYASNAQDAVSRFRADRQLYVIGQPQFQGQNLDLRPMQEMLAEHPNAYVVVIAESGNVRSDDMTLSRGIGNSSAFKGVIDQATGQSNGVVFSVYMKVTDQQFIQQTGNQRAIYMRSEQLLDDAGAGENEFMNRETNTPGRLFTAYRDAIREGQNPGQALDRVMDLVDASVARHVQVTVGGARSSVEGADQALDATLDRVKDFQRRNGERGSLGNPPVDTWKSQLRQAQDALRSRNYEQATNLSNSLRSTLSNYEQLLTRHAGGAQEAQQIRDLIAQLELQAKDAASQSSLAQAKQSMAQFQSRYEANEVDFQTHLDSARSLTQQAQRQIQGAQDAEVSKKNGALIGGSALGIGLLGLAIVGNMRARGRRQEADQELQAAVTKMSERSAALIEVMNQSDVQQMAAFTGTTQNLAKQLMEDTATALSLVGGGEKAIGQARELIKGQSFGDRFNNMFFGSNFVEAVELLTKKELPHDLQDSKNLSLEGRAAAWRDHLTQLYGSKAGKETFLQMLDQVERLTKGNAKTTEVLLKEGKEVGVYLDEVAASAKKGAESSARLQERGEFFTAPSVTKRLLPAAEQRLADGHKIKETDPFRARQEFGQVAQRQVSDGEAIVEMGNFAHSHTLPAIQATDAAVVPHDINTEWAHLRKQELSLQLDSFGEKAIEKGISQEVQGLHQALKAFEAQLGAVVALDERRWNQAQPQLKEAEAKVATAREGLCQALKAAGVFAQGTPDQVLREADRDPSAHLYEARQNYNAVKPLLDQGETSKPPAHLDKVASESNTANQLVDQSRAAFEAYPKTSNERRTQRDDTQKSIGETYKPSLERIQKTYTPHAQKAVVPEVSQSEAKQVSDLLRQSEALLDRCAGLQDQAHYNYDRAHLLTSRDQLAELGRLISLTHTHLGGITKAEGLLEQHQKTAERELTSLGGRIEQTEKNTQAVFVRKQAKSKLKVVQAELEKSRPVVFQQPASPYEANQTLAQVESARRNVESLIGSDKSAYDAGNQSIASAKAQIEAAVADIEKAARTSWQQNVNGFGQVSNSVSDSSLHSARNTVGTARQQTSEAEGHVAPQEYEQAKERGDSAKATAQKAQSQVAEAVAAAKAVFDNRVSSASAIAQAESQIRDAERQVQDVANTRWSEHVSGYGQVTHQVSSSDLSRARSYLSDAESCTTRARSAHQGDRLEEAKNQARQGEQQAEEGVREARRVLERERAVFDGLVREARQCVEAKEAISSAERDLRSAESEVSSASRQSWSQHVNNYGTVSHSVSSSDLSSAHSYLNRAESNLRSAHSYLNSKGYSSAESEANEASSNARRAESEAESAVRRAHDEFRDKVAKAEREANPPNTGGGGGSGGGGGDTGGGGGTGGGGSGSTGGGW
jgi:hypothetical protein